MTARPCPRCRSYHDRLPRLVGRLRIERSRTVHEDLPGLYHWHPWLICWVHDGRRLVLARAVSHASAVDCLPSFLGSARLLDATFVTCADAAYVDALGEAVAAAAEHIANGDTP